MRRRDFVRDGASAAVLAGVAAAQPKPPKTAKITSSVMLWTLQGSLEARLETAAKAGMQSVELVAEHVPWTDAEGARYVRMARSFGMGIDTIIAQPDWKKRPVSMVDPAQRENFLKDVRQAIAWARKLGVPYIILMSGDAIAGRTHAQQYQSLLEGARRAGELAAQAGVTLLLEPLNAKKDHAGFFLTNCTEGLKLVKEVSNPHVRLLFDIYHEHVETGNALGTLTEAAPYTSVFHVADSPGRHDPGSGTINYTDVYRAIAKTGYAGYITMEYLPLGDPVASLIKSVDQMRAALAS
jgi:hydroxypyruvate isomerase